jgi:ankyrin repeat protein
LLVRLILDRGAATDAQDENGKPALHEACAAGYEEIVQLLLGRGAAIGIMDEDGHTGFYMACDNEHEPIAKLLLKKGIDLISPDEESSRRIHVAMEKFWNGETEIKIAEGREVFNLLRQLLWPDKWDSRDDRGCVGLIYVLSHLNTRQDHP